MRNLRKKLWILLVIATAFSISACGMKEDVSEQVSEQTQDEQTAEAPDEQTTEEPDEQMAEEPDEQMAETPVSTEEEQKEDFQITDEAVSEFYSLLDEIYTDVEPGTAGNSLKSAIVATHLMDWGVATTMTADAIRTETENWLSDKGNEEQAIFTEKMGCVYNAYLELLQPGAEGLLETAGCEDANYPWTDSPDTPIEAIETIADVVQLPE